QVGHSDHVETKLSIRMRFRQSGKLRAFHANVGAGAMRFHAGRIAGISDVRRQNSASRLVEPDMRHDSAPKKCCRTQPGAIEELVRDHKIERWQIIAK